MSDKMNPDEVSILDLLKEIRQLQAENMKLRERIQALENRPRGPIRIGGREELLSDKHTCARCGLAETGEMRHEYYVGCIAALRAEVERHDLAAVEARTDCQMQADDYMEAVAERDRAQAQVKALAGALREPSEAAVRVAAEWFAPSESNYTLEYMRIGLRQILMAQVPEPGGEGK